VFGLIFSISDLKTSARLQLCHRHGRRKRGAVAPPWIFKHGANIVDIACLHGQNKSGFFEGRLLSSQSEQCWKVFKCSDWLEKKQALQNATSVLII